MSFTPFTRREFIKTVAGAGLALPLLPGISLAANPVETPLHGLSSFGNLKYPADYPHFDFANPEAPQGGTFAFSPPNWFFNQNVQTFNTLNSFVLQGEAPPRMEECFDNLMAWAWDEPDAIYCALAESVTISSDRNRYLFALRPEARFTDGSPVTAEDVAFSMMLLKEKGHPQLALDMINLIEAKSTSPNEVELVFNGKQSDRAILSIAVDSPIFSKTYYTEHEFTDSTLEPPLSSGPWQVETVEVGRFVIYRKNSDYWAKDLPFAKGLDLFDRLRIDFFFDRQAAFEAFKKGLITWREEFTSKTWATEYNFPAVSDGRVKQTYFDSELRPSMQGWAVNTRREKLSHPATRQALGVLFDFEWTNKNIFYGAYARSHSLFARSAFAVEGPPSQSELKLLEPLRDQLPETVFGDAVRQNVTNGTGRDRRVFRIASKLFAEAGWKKEGGKLVHEDGEPLSVEVLIRSPTFERLLGPYTENMRTLGIDASIRLVDASQFQSRIEAFDFDMVGIAFSFEPNPTTESLRRVFGSSSASREGSRNYPGIADAAIDSLIDAVEKVENREELIVVMRALDRVLRAGHFWIPNWHSANHRIAHWDMFGWKDPKPDYFFPVERLWWLDLEKAAAIGKG